MARPRVRRHARLKQDFEHWSSLEPGRRNQVLAAAFAAATLVDDARLPRWAVDGDDDIAQAYPFLLPAPPLTGEN
ncbi:MAG: hypothetical protein OXP28_00375 [Gammaproteobacteria bacterium]|nr:hypothetical protein [Gammaproteobacteria bacterium]MDE0223574.1 hypothetical protein [Gammaproteobacteria bacterium]